MLIKEQKRRLSKSKGSISVEMSKESEVEDCENDTKAVSKNDISAEDKKCCPDGGPVDWPDNDPRWGNPPTVGRPTVVHAKFLIDQLQDLCTVRGTIYVRIGIWLDWTDHRLAGRSRMDPLPDMLWSPRPTLSEAMGDLSMRTCEFALQIGTLEGKLSTLTWYEGTIKNPMDLHLFPLDTDTLDITFFASDCYRRNGESNVNYKTDYRLLFIGWQFATPFFPEATPYGWDIVSSTVKYVWHDFPQDVLQIQLHLKRHVNFYFFKVVFPLLLITCLNFMGFFLEDDNLGERLAHNITLFLSALALLYVVGQDLPKTTFLTSIDRIVVVTLTLIFVTSLHFVFLKKLAEESVSSMPLTKHDYKTVLYYFSGYMAYLILEFLYLLFRRHIQCKEFQKNLDKDRVFKDGIDEHNKNVQEDLTYQMGAWLMIDPFRMVLVKKKDSRALFLPQLLTKVAVPVQLFLPSSGKAVVMSSRPEFKHEGIDVQWMTLGSPIRALEVVFDTDQCIKVCLNCF